MPGMKIKIPGSVDTRPKRGNVSSCPGRTAPGDTDGGSVMFVIRVYGGSCDYYVSAFDAARGSFGGTMNRRDAAQFPTDADAGSVARELFRTGRITRWEIVRA